MHAEEAFIEQRCEREGAERGDARFVDSCGVFADAYQKQELELFHSANKERTEIRMDDVHSRWNVK